MQRKLSLFTLGGLLALFSTSTMAAEAPLDLTNTNIGIFALAVFVFAYILVMAEEYLHLRKSKPVLVAAGIIWVAIGWVYMNNGFGDLPKDAFRHNLLEYAELLLFLLVAMTYISAMEDRGLFD